MKNGARFNSNLGSQVRRENSLLIHHPQSRKVVVPVPDLQLYSYNFHTHVVIYAPGSIGRYLGSEYITLFGVAEMVQWDDRDAGKGFVLDRGNVAKNFYLACKISFVNGVTLGVSVTLC